MKRNYYKKAKEISKLSMFPKVHIGCIAVYKKNIIGVGFNSRKTNPLQAKYNSYRNLVSNNGKPINDFIHAEISCLNSIKDLDIDFIKYSLSNESKQLIPEEFIEEVEESDDEWSLF